MNITEGLEYELKEVLEYELKLLLFVFSITLSALTEPYCVMTIGNRIFSMEKPMQVVSLTWN
jgi:hypothetical protein